MRIDYFLVSEKFKDRILACEIHGRGIELQGSSTFISFLLCFHVKLKLMLELSNLKVLNDNDLRIA